MHGIDIAPRPIAEQPILILGSHRSGTSVFTHALRKGARIAGYNEGHFLSLLPGLLDITDRFYKRAVRHDGSNAIAVAQLPRTLMRAELVRLAFGMMDRLHRGARWVDKTPGPLMIEVALAVSEVALGTRIVFLHRRAIENVVSRVAKARGGDVQTQAKGWVAIMARWREVRALLPADSWIEVDQHDVAHHPDAVVARAAPFLGLTPRQAEGMASMLHEGRNQQLASAEVGRVLTLHETGWSAAVVAEFREIVAAEMAAWGYGWGDDYHLSRSVAP